MWLKIFVNEKFYLFQELDIDNNELIIKNIKRTSKLDRVECHITNGYGPSATRSFKININRKILFIFIVKLLSK